MLQDETLPFSQEIFPSEVFPDPAPIARLDDDNNLDDIWGSAPSSADLESFSSDANHVRHEPSDVPRLRSQHSTSGYREGMSAAKNTTIQEGFDEGYSLGAVIGLEVGIVLGVLEGICNAIMYIDDDKGSETKAIVILLETARRELHTEQVFGREWWSEDGTWRYEVIGESGRAGDFTFKEVVDSHPLIKKWKGLVKAESEKWGLDLMMMEKSEEKRIAIDDGG